MLEFRLWNRALSIGEMSEYSQKRLTGYELGLLDNFPLNEGQGKYSFNRVVSGSDLAVEEAAWNVPDGIGMILDGKEGFLIEPERFSRTNYQDYTMSFWFRTTDNEGTLLSNGKAENEAAAQAEALKNWRPEPVKEPNSFDEFEKNDIRVATVLECTPVKKSERLLQFKLDDGMGGRTILSGIAQSYPDPSVLVGKQVLFIANFPPRKMMGIESQGMILSAVDADGKLVVTTVSAPVKNGCQVG